MFNGIMLASGFCSGSHHCKSSVVLEHHFQIFFLWHLVSALGEIHPPSGADQTTKCIYHSWHTFCIDGYSKHPCISQLQSTLWFLVVSTLLAASSQGSQHGLLSSLGLQESDNSINLYVCGTWSTVHGFHLRWTCVSHDTFVDESNVHTFLFFVSWPLSVCNKQRW